MSAYSWYTRSSLSSRELIAAIASSIGVILRKLWRVEVGVNPFLVAIVLFALGSGVAGGAYHPAMLIGGRPVQGLGAAGLYVLSDILICDLVPPRHRGPYLSAVMTTAGIGSTIGPVVGGVIAEHNWRWVFYLNVPISFLGFVVMLTLLKVKHNRSASWSYALARIDYLGAIIFIPSLISSLYGLITGGIQHSWSSWRVVLPIVLGICGWILYHVQQATPSLCASPSTPPHLFTNRSHSILMYIVAFFLPLYFQSAKLISPLMSGVYYLPFALAIIPFAGFSGWALSRWGKYIPLHYAGFAMLSIGMGLFSMLDDTSSRAAWIGFQIFPSAGIALIYTATLPSTLAALEEKDVAVATATCSFLRTFGFSWGVAMAGIVFNAHVDARLGTVSDEGLREALRNGAAYAFAGNEGGLRDPKDPIAVKQVLGVYAKALRSVWLVAMAVALLGFVCVPVERSIELKRDHTTEYGLVEKETKTNQVTSGTE
ncbi:major facilitator superfamily domain-containing protein [Massariosphaeria phaeospora]|uniref:Major facilitator superfamily domain-containing protein n=1 Tax=Massariosphaeria phaeospora TaxID=100035 RepID=A0A7C8I8D5_9PLEO|nr:major facilitator superfamily domain-containing protein [Massariosphaeria phaeospora]